MERIQTADLPASAPPGTGVFKRSPLSRLSFGHMVMITAGLLAFLLNVFLLRSKGETLEVLVAARPISVGSRIEPDDLATELVDAGSPFIDRVLSGDATGQLLGFVAVRDIDAGAPLISDDLRPPAAAGGERAMSIPISPDHAVGAALYAGDRVDVIAVDGGHSRFVATAIEVLDVSSGGARTSGDRLGIVVVVSEAEALAIAGALDGAAVHLVRSTGADEEVDVSPLPVDDVRKGEPEP